MIYYLHHSAGNVVIRTNNPYIVLQYQRKGWITTPLFEEVLEAHMEWQTPQSLSSDTIVTKVRPRGVRSIVTFINTDNEVGQAMRSNAKPIHWLTAIEREMYGKHSLMMPQTSWISCKEGDEAFEYSLKNGIWELETGLQYTDQESLEDGAR
ncbi:hypothetical protein GQ44DRAFT_608515 [Phaeosphaeriaceae sp. PMI808]|nr:hypothetical protein GQ44DRAFT_608515 [Phaeosphaeriaceae sp. PMI808]